MPFQFAITATFTAEPIEPVVAFWSRKLHWPAEIRFAPYNQVAQTLLDPASAFARNTEGANVILLRPEDLVQANSPNGSALELIRTHFGELLELTCRARRTGHVPIVFVLCPASQAFLAHPGAAELVQQLADAAAGMFRNTPGISFLQHEDIQKFYPVTDVFSQEGDRVGRIAYTEIYFAALGTALVRHVHALVSQRFKLIALDCDNTLWQGICGEDGASGIVVDTPHRALQQFMLDQRDAGMLLALASKNNERDVLDAFEQNSTMPLRLDSFVSRRLNWDPKSSNLASLAEELSLSPESFIFVDDNPVECAEVQENLPEVLTLTLPPDAGQIPKFLSHIWAFDHAVVTAEDRRRSEMYAQTLAFGREIQSAGSMEHFLEKLNLRVSFVPPSPERLGRIAQLTERTNQFNFTTIRRTAAEISSLIESGDLECLGVEVSDRFGDYGLTGVLMFRVAGSALEVDTFLLSCRVLGRGVEHRLLAHLAEEASRRGASTVVAEVRATPRNEPARQFLHNVALVFEQPFEGGVVYHLPVALASRAKWQPSRAVSPVADRKPEQARPRNRPDYEFIATNLRTAVDILEAIRADARGEHPTPSTLWESDTEATLATMWSELLHKPGIKRTDNFFDLGGHSLLVVLLIVRIRETFGVELPIEDVYSGEMTLLSLARSIDRRVAGSDPDYDALVDEIGRMSDEEVARLLAEEDPGVPFS